MEKRQGKIEKKSMAFAKNKAPYATFTIDGKNYNSFDATIIDAHNPDDFVEITGEQDGPYWTMKTMKKIEAIEEALKPDYPTPKNGKEYHLSPEQVRTNGMAFAIDWAKCKAAFTKEIISAEELFKAADTFVEWIRDGN